MKKFSKLIALVLSTVMVLTLLTACNPSNDPMETFDQKFKSDPQKQAEVLSDLNEVRKSYGSPALSEVSDADAIAKKYASLVLLHNAGDLSDEIYHTYWQHTKAKTVNGKSQVGFACVNASLNKQQLSDWGVDEFYRTGSAECYSKLILDTNTTMVGIAVVEQNGKTCSCIVSY